MSDFALHVTLLALSVAVATAAACAGNAFMVAVACTALLAQSVATYFALRTE